MLFAPRSATVIEFEHVPHVDRVFGSIAMALGLDYWLVPEVSTHLFRNYTMTAAGVHAIMDLVQHVIRSRYPDLLEPPTSADIHNEYVRDNVISCAHELCSTPAALWQLAKESFLANDIHKTLATFSRIISASPDDVEA